MVGFDGDFPPMGSQSAKKIKPKKQIQVIFFKTGSLPPSKWDTLGLQLRCAYDRNLGVAPFIAFAPFRSHPAGPTNPLSCNI